MIDEEVRQVVLQALLEGPRQVGQKKIGQISRATQGYKENKRKSADATWL